MSAPQLSTIEVPSKTVPSVGGAPRGRTVIDAGRLWKELSGAVTGEVRFDPGTLAMYANDSSNFRQVPIGVVVPRTLEDVVATHRICHRFSAPLLSRGGGTSLSGETVNRAVVIDHSKYLTHIGNIDPAGRLVRCEHGVINEELNGRTGAYNLIFGPDPSTHSRCVIGGNIGNNSCGVHSVQSQLYGPGPRTSDNVEAMEIVTYDGSRFWVVSTRRAIWMTSSPQAGAKVRSTPPYAICGTATPTRSAPATRRWTSFPGECPGTTSTSCCRRGASMSPAPWSERRAPAPPPCRWSSN